MTGATDAFIMHISYRSFKSRQAGSRFLLPEVEEAGSAPRFEGGVLTEGGCDGETGMGSKTSNTVAECEGNEGADRPGATTLD
jgi:hypothetical protein